MQKLKTRGILMTSDNAIKVKNRTKTQTRRLVPELNAFCTRVEQIDPLELGEKYLKAKFRVFDLTDTEIDVVSFPFGTVGDELWIREEHIRSGYWIENGKKPSGYQKWRFVPEENPREENCFFPDDKHAPDCRISRDTVIPEKVQWYKRLARFMPYHLARTKVQITGIRLERLQQITEKDAIAEGASDHMDIDDLNRMKGMDWKIPSPFLQHQFGFMALWCKIHSAESWLDNPWVWVITFKKIS